jgi:leucyl aminopeptidase
MQIQPVFSLLPEVDTEALAVIVLDREPRVSGAAAEVDRGASGIITELTRSGEFSGRAFDNLLVMKPGGLKARRLLLVGGGKPQALGIHELRRLAGSAARFLKGRSVRSFTFVAPAELPPEQAVLAIVTGIHGANFEPGR